MVSILRNSILLLQCKQKKWIWKLYFIKSIYDFDTRPGTLGEKKSGGENDSFREKINTQYIHYINIYRFYF